MVSEKIRKGVVITFLVMLVIGFVVPGFLNLDSSQETPELRVCLSDQDCSLKCGSQQFKVLCSLNICQQNSCKEQPLYPYQETPLEFSFNLDLNGKVSAPGLQSEVNDLFVKFSGDKVYSFSSFLPLSKILEKGQAIYDEKCFTLRGTNYCSEENSSLTLLVNDEPNLYGENYVPKAGDQVILKYTSLEG